MAGVVQEWESHKTSPETLKMLTVQSVYSEDHFERRFGVPRKVFEKVKEHIMGESFFVQREDCTGKKGIHPLVQLVSCFRILSYGDCSDRSDEYLQISETVACESFKEFCRLVVKFLSTNYLNRCPTDSEKEEVLSISNVLVFQVALPRGIASISIGNGVQFD